MTIDMDTAVATTFEPLIGKQFRVLIEGADLSLKLEKIDMLNIEGMRTSHLEVEGKVLTPREPFSLVFSGPSNPSLGSGVCPLGYGDNHQISLFLSPFQQDETGTQYECVLN